MPRLVVIIMGIGLLGWANLARADSLDDWVAQAASQGLPTQPLQNKINEGRAKHVPLLRITQVIARLVQSMRSARQWLASSHHPADPRLLWTVAEAELAGLSLKTIQAVLPSGSTAKEAARVDSLVDLTLRGYPDKTSVVLVKATSLAETPLLGAALDALRQNQDFSAAEAMDEMIQAVKNNKGSLNKAIQAIPKNSQRAKTPSNQSKKSVHKKK